MLKRRFIAMKQFCFSSRVLSLLCTLAVVAVVVAGCGDGIGDVEDGELVVEPDPVSFPSTDIGESQMRTVNLRNAGDTVIRLTDPTLIDDPDQEGTAEVFELDAWDGDELLDPDDVATIDVTYTPEASESYNGLIAINTNLAGDDTELRIQVEANAPQPEILGPDSISFERVPTGSEESMVAELENIGSAPLEIDDIFLAAVDPYDVNSFDVSFPTRVEDIDMSELSEDEQNALEDAEIGGPKFDTDSPESVIDPGEVTWVRVYFEAPSEAFQAAELLVNSNDPDAGTYRIPVNANSEAACLEVLGGSEIDFGNASIGNTTHQTVTLVNCSSNTETTIRDIRLGDLDGDGDFDEDAEIKFGLDDESLPEPLQEGNNKPIDAGETVSILMSYSPIEEEENSAVLELESNDDASPLHVDVLGEGVDADCPVAVPQARIEGAGAWSDSRVFGLPLDVIELDGSESHDPDGTDLTYDWFLADAPSNSTAQIDDPQSETPTLSTDIAGDFVIELTVYDELGLAACEPARITGEIAPESDVHIELTWDVPAADDGTGTDLDLHYLHPTGQWSQAPEGVYYANPNPEWNDGSEVWLDIDDLYGEEPENINHDNPDPAYNYPVGVYYFGDHFAYGATDARVRIYIGDQLFYQEERRLENDGGQGGGSGDFWYVGDVEVEGGLSFNEINELHEDAGFPDASQ